MSTSSQLEKPLSTDEIYILYLLYRAKETGISGRVRLQKVVYILKEGLSVPFTFDFAKRKYGPFSENLMNLIAKLKSEGYLEERKKGREFDYVLTDDGRRFAEQVVLEKLSKDIKSRIDNTIEALLETGVGHLTHLAYAIKEVKT